MSLRKGLVPLSGAVLLLLLTTAAAADLISYADARADAARRHVPLVVEFGTEWCGPCRKFAADSESHEALKRTLATIALYRCNAEKGEGPRLAPQFKILAYPTFVMINEAGETTDRWMGYDGPGGLILRLTATLGDSTSVAMKESRYRDNPTAGLAARLGEIKNSQGDYREAVNYYRDAQKLNTYPEVSYSMDIFGAVADGNGQELFTLEEVRTAAEEASSWRKTSNYERCLIALMMTQASRRAGKPEVAAPFLTAGLKAAETDSSARAFLSTFRIDHALIVLKDSAKALEYKRQSMAPKWQEDSGALNDFAWWCFENRLNLDEADQLVRKAVALAGPGPDKAQILDTAAEIAAARGNSREAVALAGQAVKEDPDRQYYKKQFDRFRAVADSAGATGSK